LSAANERLLLAGMMSLRRSGERRHRTTTCRRSIGGDGRQRALNGCTARSEAAVRFRRLERPWMLKFWVPSPTIASNRDSQPSYRTSSRPEACRRCFQPLRGCLGVWLLRTRSSSPVTPFPTASGLPAALQPFTKSPVDELSCQRKSPGCFQSGQQVGGRPWRKGPTRDFIMGSLAGSYNGALRSRLRRATQIGTISQSEPQFRGLQPGAAAWTAASGQASELPCL